MARYSLVCSCPSVLPSLKVSDCPSCTHPRRDQRVGFSQFQKNIHGMKTTSAYSAKVFDTLFEEICTTPSMTVISTCEVFVTAESLLVSIWFHPCFSFPDKKRQCWRIFIIFVLEKLTNVTFSENPTRGSRLQCIHEGQSDTLNEGKQTDRNTQANVSPCQASRELEKCLTN